jgi:hypothetical protein
MRNMKVADLIHLLEDADPDAEIRLMTQQNYPFENSVVGVWEPPATEKEAEDGEGFAPADGDDFGHRGAGPAPKVLYLVEGRQLGYGTKDAWNQ